MKTTTIIISLLISTIICNASVKSDSPASPTIYNDNLAVVLQYNDIDSFIHQLNYLYGDSALSVKVDIILTRIKDLPANAENTLNKAKCYYQLGTYYRRDNQYNKAIEFYQKAQISDNEEINIKILNSLGVAHRRLDQLQSAASCHLQALKRIETYTGNYDDIAFQHRISLNSIGNIYITLKQFDEALEYFNKSIKLEIEVNNHLGMAINYSNMGFCYQSLDDFDNARTNYQLSLTENQTIKSNLGQSISHNTLGELYMEEDSMHKAMQHFDSAQVYSSQLYHDYYHQSITHTNLARGYLYFEQLDQAKEQLDILKQMAFKTKSLSVCQNYYSINSSYFEKLDNIDSAFFYFRQASVFNDSIMNEANTSYINDLLSYYESEKKTQQIELLSSQNETNTQRKKLWLALSLLLLVALILVFYIEQNKKKRQVLEMEILQQQLLRTQMNPHFLFNALGSIQNFMLTNKTQEAAKYLNNFASLTRSILEHSSKKEISLDDEINTLHHYIKLEQLRSNHNFDYQIKYSEQLETEFIYIHPMLIQPFVENAIKHGFTNIAYKGELQISFSEDKNILTITISDNGIGISKKQPKSSTHRSMSMSIFQKRQKYIWKNEKKRIHYSVINKQELSPKSQGTLVTINLPISS